MSIVLRLKAPWSRKRTKCKHIKTWFTSRQAMWRKVSICAVYLGLINCGSCFSLDSGSFSSSFPALLPLLKNLGLLTIVAVLEWSSSPLTYHSLNLPGSSVFGRLATLSHASIPPTHPPIHPSSQPASNKHLALLELLKLYRHILLSDKTSLEGKKSPCVT